MDAPRKHDKYDALIKACDALAPAKTAVAHPCDEISLSAAVAAANANLIVPLLVGPKGRIEALASSLRLELSGAQVVDAPHSHAAAARAVAMSSPMRMPPVSCSEPGCPSS